MNTKTFVLAPKALVRDACGRYLFLRRSARSKHFAHCWEMPGGKMDRGEIIDQNLRHEVFEETGLRITSLRVAGAAEGEIEQYRLAYLFFHVEAAPGEVVFSDEHDAFIWANAEEATRLELCPALVEFVRGLYGNET